MNNNGDHRFEYNVEHMRGDDVVKFRKICSILHKTNENILSSV